MVSSPGVGKMLGMSGFDWAIYKDNTSGTNADLLRLAFDANPVPPENAALDVYEAIEGLSGSSHNDLLSGSNVDELTNPLEGFRGSALDASGIALINGLQAVLGTGVSSFSAGDIILGGDGNDIITGRGGDDIIDGDKYMNVRISVRASFDENGPLGAEIATANSMTQLVTQMFNRTYNPGQLQIVREILTANGTGDIDTAVFSDVRANYTISSNTDGTLTVAHTGGTQADGVDRVRNIEMFKFSDVEIPLASLLNGAAFVSDTTPTEGQTLSAVTSSIVDPQGVGPFSYQWQSSSNGTTWVDIAGATGVNFTPQDLPGITAGAQAGLQLRVRVQYTDGAGNPETQFSGATAPVGRDWDGPNTASVFTGNPGDDIADGGNAGDTLNGNAGSDDLDGNGGNDTLNGGDGLDTLEGGAGNDIVNGGAGDDTILYLMESDGADTVNGGLDADTLVIQGNDNDDEQLDVIFNGVSITRFEAAGALGTVTGVETITADLGIGDTNTLSYNGTLAGVSVLVDLSLGTASGFSLIANVNNVIGGAGADTLIGGLGNNNLNGGGGNDVFVVNDTGDTVTEGGGGGIDQVNSLANTFTIGDADVENLTFTGDGNFTGTGNNSANVITGGAGSDTLNGLGGADTMNGLAGNDTINYTIGGGADNINGGDGTDTLAIIANGGNDTLTVSYDGTTLVNLGPATITGIELISANLGGGNNTLSYAGPGTTVGVAVNLTTNTAPGFNGIANINNVTGGNFNDTLIGSGVANILTGGGGSDTLMGAGGTDTAAFLSARANYGFSLVGGNVVVTDLRAGSPDGADTLTSIETVSFPGETLALRVGTDAGQTMTFNGGADLLLGFGGNDTLNSGGGTDVLVGGAGNDALNGGAGDDTAVFSGPISSYSFALVGANLTVTGPDGTDTLNSIETVQFATQVLDLNFGTAAGNTLDTGAGADLLLGLGGDDELDGGAGADVLVGGAGNDDFNFDDGNSGVGAANRDVILDFLGGGGAEDIDLSAVDANTGSGGDQAFSATIGTAGAAFTAAGQVRYEYIDTDGIGGADSTLIKGNVNAGLTADFEILLQGYTGPIVATDFIL